MSLQWRSATQEGVDSPNYPATDWVLFPCAMTFGGEKVLAEAIEQWLAERDVPQLTENSDYYSVEDWEY